jgi:hypothetical protein
MKEICGKDLLKVIFGSALAALALWGFAWMRALGN